MATNTLYTTKTAALKATKADINKLDAKKMLLNGKNIEELWGLNLPQDYPKLITRTQLYEDDNYVLYDDYGNFLFMNFSDKLVNGSYLFYQKNITEFNYDLPNLMNGDGMFYGCTALSSFTTDLPSLTTGCSMFYNCTALSSFKSDLSSLTDGSSMFGHTKISSFTSDLSNLTDGSEMFYNCDNLTTLSSDSSGSPMNLSSLDIGRYMFSGCSKIKSFNSDLSSLTDGYMMFSSCYGLESFSSNLSSLDNGTSMFSSCYNLESFSSDLSSLTDGSGMFYGCSELESFNSDLSNVTDGSSMFYNCTKLTSFNSNLSSLTNGWGMFSGCNLDYASIEKIFSSIPTYTSDYHELYVEVQQSGANKIQEITGLTPSQDWQITYYKGWQISFKIKS